MPHTADIIVEAWAPTRELCLAEAVKGLTTSYADTSTAVPSARHTFRIVATTEEQTLAFVLDEALYVLDALGEVPIEAHFDTAPGELHGRFELAPVGEVELVGSVPKGIALSGLTMVSEDGLWRAVATVDV